MKHKKHNRRKEVLWWLMQGHKITARQAYPQFNLTQLADPIRYWRGKGYPILDDWKEGSGVRYKVYFMDPEYLKK